MPRVDTWQADDLLERFQSLARTEDRELRAELIELHLSLVRQLARRFANRGEALEDLVQVGCVALVKAVDRFNPELGYEFSGFATMTIVGELKRHFRDKGWAIRAPRRVQELSLQLRDEQEQLTHLLGRSPTLRELAEATGAREDDVLEALEAGGAYRSSSLDAPGPDGGSMLDQLGVVDDAFVHAEEWHVLAPLLCDLSVNERTILRMRFGEDMTQAEIAAKTGLSQMHISRLLSRSITRLRVACNPPD